MDDALNVFEQINAKYTFSFFFYFVLPEFVQSHLYGLYMAISHLTSTSEQLMNEGNYLSFLSSFIHFNFLIAKLNFPCSKQNTGC